MAVLGALVAGGYFAAPAVVPALLVTFETIVFIVSGGVSVFVHLIADKATAELCILAFYTIPKYIASAIYSHSALIKVGIPLGITCGSCMVGGTFLSIVGAILLQINKQKKVNKELYSLELKMRK